VSFELSGSSHWLLALLLLLPASTFSTASSDFSRADDATDPDIKRCNLRLDQATTFFLPVLLASMAESR
jgi:hypothetical protein